VADATQLRSEQKAVIVPHWRARAEETFRGDFSKAASRADARETHEPTAIRIDATAFIASGNSSR
jgi:hypothetical protein